MSNDTKLTVPSYWHGQAPDFSRSVALAHEGVRVAKDRLTETLRQAYPLGSGVLVIHHRGAFPGIVAGWDAEGCRVVVKNGASGKVSKWWAAHVQSTKGTP